MCIYLRGKTYWYEFQCLGKRYRCSTGTSNKDEAKAIEYAARLRAKSKKDAIQSAQIITGRIPYKRTIDPAWLNPLYVDELAKKLHQSCLGSARKRKKENNLTVDDVHDLLIECEGACMVSGIPLDATRRTKNARAVPMQPSLDRINSHLGYSKSNCRIVSYAVNVALGQWGDALLVEIAHGIVKNQSSHTHKSSHNTTK